MGLDMYLYKKTYVKNWDHHPPEARHTITVKKGGKVRTDIKPERISEITEQVCYWRKANAIHEWFVQHVQHGKDDCGSYYVSREQLQELKDACDKVLKVIKTKKAKVNAGWQSSRGETKELLRDGEKVVDPQIAETVLPTKEGPFFGGTDYDDGYINDLKHTSKTIGQLLKEEEEKPDGQFEYQSSW